MTLEKIKSGEIYVIEIPIPDYEGTGIFHQQLFFDSAPSKKHVLDVLLGLHERDRQYPDYSGTWKRCIKAVNQLEKWETAEDNLLEASTFVEVEKIGSAHFTWARRAVFQSDDLTNTVSKHS